MKTWAIVVAAGQGTRMGGGVPKQYRLLAGVPVLEHALRPLLEAPDLAGIVVVLAAKDGYWPQTRYAHHPRVSTAVGGASRAESVLAGLHALQAQAAPDDWVLVHDAARPLLDAADLARLRAELATHPVGGLLGVPVADTLKQVDVYGTVRGSVPRAGLWRALTPQLFRHAPLHAALMAALAQGRELTDEASALEAIGQQPRMVRGSPMNLKLTQAEDWPLVQRLVTAGELMRIGHGYDAHRLTEGRRLVLGGVEIPHAQGLAAHSDGDVAIHALCDALLGAAALGDIGQHFPDRDPAYAGIESRILLRRVMQLLHEAHLRVVNADLTLVAQAPRLAPHIPAMRECLAADLAVPVAQVNVKATTTEGMGFAGRCEGIAAHAVVLLTEWAGG